MVFSFLIPSSITSEEPSISNNSLCCSSDTSSAVWQQQKTMTSQWHSHCVMFLKENTAKLILDQWLPAEPFPSIPVLGHTRVALQTHTMDSFFGVASSTAGSPCFTWCWSRWNFWRCFHLIWLFCRTSVPWCYGAVGTRRQVSQATSKRSLKWAV